MKKFLIADDHATVRRGLKTILQEKFPFAAVEEAGNAEEVMALLHRQSYDLLISDLSMPGRSGLDLLQQVKSQCPALPVLIVSMHPEEQYARRVLKAGASGYISKDAASEELLAAVDKVLSGKRYISTSLAEQMADDLNQDPNLQPHQRLSDREYDVFLLLAGGRSVSQIAEQFSLSVTTISTYRSRILAKMNLDSNAALTRYALDNSLI